MSTTVIPPVALPAPVSTSTAPAIRPVTTTRVRRFLGYTVRSYLGAIRNVPFVAFLIALPTGLYLFYASMYGNQTTNSGVNVSALMMVTMAAYGGLGAALSAGNAIQQERGSGWFRQLALTAMAPLDVMVAKVLVAVAMMVPALGAVFIAGAAKGVTLTPAEWASCFGLLLAALAPMVILGLALGLWFKAQAASAGSTLLTLMLSMLGGLWFPLDMMPDAMQTVGKLLPSYWAGQLGLWPILGGGFPWQGVGVIAAWTVALIALGVVGYRRAVRSSRR